MDAMHEVHAVVTMTKGKLHKDGTDHSESRIAGRRRSWEDDIDASWTTKDRAVGVEPWTAVWECGSGVAGFPDVSKEKSRRQ